VRRPLRNFTVIVPAVELYKNYHSMQFMKSVVLAFEDAEFARLKQAKGTLTWRDFVLGMAESVDQKAAEGGPSPDSPSSPSPASAATVSYHHDPHNRKARK